MSKKNKLKKKTLKTFVTEFREKFPELDYLDFTKSEYINSKTKMKVYCTKHNTYFYERPSNIIRGILSCPVCKKNIANDLAKKTFERGKLRFLKFLEEFYPEYEYDINKYQGTNVKFLLVNKYDKGESINITPAGLRNRHNNKEVNEKSLAKESYTSSEIIMNILGESKKISELTFLDIEKICNYVYGDKYKVIEETIAHNRGVVLLCTKHSKKINTNIFKIIHGQTKCSICSRIDSREKVRKQNEVAFIKLINDNCPHIDTSEVYYVTERTKVKIRCKIHNVTKELLPYTIKEKISRGDNICDLCKNELIVKEKTKWFVIEYNSKYPDHNYDLSNVVFKGFHDNITVRCKIHNTIMSTRPYEFLYENSSPCPFCRSSRSKLEKSIETALNNLGIDFEEEFVVPIEDIILSGNKCLNKRDLRIDFVVNYNNEVIFIEAHGKQHFELSNIFHSSATEDEIFERFIKQISRDRALRGYCSVQKIKLIEIPYDGYFNKPELIEKLFRDIIILGGNPKDFIKLPEIDSKYLKLVEMYEQ